MLEEKLKKRLKWFEAERWRILLYNLRKKNVNVKNVPLFHHEGTSLLHRHWFQFYSMTNTSSSEEERDSSCRFGFRKARRNTETFPTWVSCGLLYLFLFLPLCTYRQKRYMEKWHIDAIDTSLPFSWYLQLKHLFNQESFWIMELSCIKTRRNITHFATVVLKNHLDRNWFVC